MYLPSIPSIVHLICVCMPLCKLNGGWRDISYETHCCTLCFPTMARQKHTNPPPTKFSGSTITTSRKFHRSRINFLRVGLSTDPTEMNKSYSFPPKSSKNRDLSSIPAWICTQKSMICSWSWLRYLGKSLGFLGWIIPFFLEVGSPDRRNKMEANRVGARPFC